MEINKLERYKKQYRVEIDSLREFGKTDDEINEFISGVEKKLQIEKVKNLITVLQKNPTSLSNIKALMDYRKLKVLKQYYENEYDLSNNTNKLKIQELEAQVSKTQDIALNEFSNLISTYKKLGVNPFYIGEYEEISNIDTKEYMTDSLFSLLNAIEDVELRELEIENIQDKQAVEKIKELNYNERDLNITSNQVGFEYR